MHITRKLSAAATGAAVAIGLITIPASPAAALTTVCRTTYLSGGWTAYPCVMNNEGRYGARATLTRYPDDPSSGCYKYRVYLVAADGTEIRSTSQRPCSEENSPSLGWYDAHLLGYAAKARFKAYDSSQRVILVLDSPWIA